MTPEDLARLTTFANILWDQDDPIPEAAVEELRGSVTAIITGHWHYGSVKRFPALHTIIEVAGGFPYMEDLDYTSCFRRGIKVLSCAPAFAPAAAEMALAMSLCAARRIVENHEAFRVGNEKWGWRGNGESFLLSGRTLGIVGFGNIGRKLCSFLEPFRCRIRIHDPWLTDGYILSYGAEPSSLDDLLASSEVIFVVAAPTASNRAILDERRLRLIQPGGALILISRAHLVDFDALIRVVTEGHLYAAIDVFPEEPLAGDHPLRDAPNVLLSAHRSGGLREAYHMIGRMIVNDLEAIKNGLIPQQLQMAYPETLRHRGEGFKDL